MYRVFSMLCIYLFVSKSGDDLLKYIEIVFIKKVWIKKKCWEMC